MADKPSDTPNTDSPVVAVPYADRNNVPNERDLEMKEKTDETAWRTPREGQTKAILDTLKARIPSGQDSLVY